jgi:hypothetical protein
MAARFGLTRCKSLAQVVLVRGGLKLGERGTADDAYQTDLFEIFTFREYADLMVRLAPIHADIRARGWVYGKQP